MKKIIIRKLIVRRKKTNVEDLNVKKRPLLFYVVIFLGIFILLNAFIIGLLFFRQ
jgi:hypothetical protein